MDPVRTAGTLAARMADTDPNPLPAPVPGAPASPPVTPTDVVRREELERALAEIDRLTRDAKDHAATRSTAERQAADLQTLRKFHEKAHAEIEKLKIEKATLAAEKADLQKKAAAAVEERRKREQAEAELERVKHELAALAAEKVAQVKKAAEGGSAPLKEAAPAPGRAAHADTGLPTPAIMTAPEAKKSDAPATADNRIRYLCAGCGKKMATPPEFAGTFGTCRFCGHRMQVPAKSTR